jgi:hypothetical protein
VCWLFLVVLVLHCQAVPIISLQNLSPNGQNVSKRGLRAGRRCRPFVSSQIYYFSLFGCRNPTYGIDKALLSTLALTSRRENFFWRKLHPRSRLIHEIARNFAARSKLFACSSNKTAKLYQKKRSLLSMKWDRMVVTHTYGRCQSSERAATRSRGDYY